jgi:hypothetical protein
LNVKVLVLSTEIYYSLIILDREVEAIKILGHENISQINVENYTPGIYLLVLKEGLVAKASGKFLVVR